MRALFRLPPLAGVLLLAAAPFAGADSPLPDPVAPAVIGRPLEQVRPARPVRQKPAAAKPRRPATVTASRKAAPTRPSAPVAVAPAVAPAVVQQAVAQRAVPPARAVDPGAYFSSKDQALVRRYYEAHPVSGPLAPWKVGEPIPERAALTGVPDALRAALPVLPPGHQYVQLDDEVVLVAVQSRRVMDGVRRGVR